MLKLNTQRIKVAMRVGFGVGLILGVVFWSVVSVGRANREEKYQKRLSDAVEYCESLFDETSVVLLETTDEELTDCQERLAQISEAAEAEQLRGYVENAMQYRSWVRDTEEYLDENGDVLEELQGQELALLTENAKKLAEPYQGVVNERLNYMTAEFEAMRETEDAVNLLFTGVDRETVKDGITRADVDVAKAKVDGVKQVGLKERLEKALEVALAKVEDNERIVRERIEAARRAREEELRKIAESWTRLDISPYYINQYDAGLYNGCEAASLLMALKYKGYIRGADFRTFADGIPASDDPNTGFYLSMADLEPREEAHWIAPAPLAAYGASMSGANVINATGWSLAQLNSEVQNGNPVIIYMTYKFNDPKEYSKGVPKNLHVLVLSGYNSYTGEQQFYDPWPVGGKNPTLSGARTEYLYGASGMRALVVR